MQMTSVPGPLGSILKCVSKLFSVPALTCSGPNSRRYSGLHTISPPEVPRRASQCRSREARETWSTGAGRGSGCRLLFEELGTGEYLISISGLTLKTTGSRLSIRWRMRLEAVRADEKTVCPCLVHEVCRTDADCGQLVTLLYLGPRWCGRARHSIWGSCP